MDSQKIVAGVLPHDLTYQLPGSTAPRPATVVQNVLFTHLVSSKSTMFLLAIVEVAK
jgi:hypothetical protein